MKRIFTLALALQSFVPIILAQDFIYDPDKKEKSDVEVYAEGKGREKKKILLISYKPVMHLPDPAGDVELIMKSGQDMHRVYNRIRQALEVSLSEKLREGFTVISLLRTNDSTKADLHKVYGVANYDYADRPVEISESKKVGKNCCPEILGSSRRKPSKDVETDIRGGQLSSRDVDRSKQYMNVSISDASLISYLTSKYDVDMFVFVNQFELKKSFVEGSDVAYGTYGREVVIHYTILDNKGVQLYGNRSSDKIFEKQDNINEIIAKTFPVISSDVYSHTPGSDQAEAAEKLDKENLKKAEKQDILRKD